MDLLISTLKLSPLATVQEPTLLPCVGNDAFQGEPGSMCTELEVYGRLDSPYAVVQQRSPAATGRQDQLAANIASFLQTAAQVQQVTFSCWWPGIFQRLRSS